MPNIFNISIIKIRHEDRYNIEIRASKVNYPGISYLEKIMFVLKQHSSTKNNIQNLLDNKSQNSIISVLSSSNIINDSFINYSLPNMSDDSYTKSTLADSNINSLIQFESTNIDKPSENKFNDLRTNFYLKNKLYDFILYENINDFNLPLKYVLNEEYDSFLYINDNKTYCFTVSGFLKNDKNYKKELKEEEIRGKFYKQCGLYFCNSEVEITTEDEIIRKKCCPNEFMCRDCVETNRNMYNIKKRYLININGRVAKINKGSYHCFGHFLCGNQIEDCITKFTCKACQILNLFSDYFNQRKKY